MTESHFIQVWRDQLASPESGLHLASPNHILQFFVGVTELRSPRLVLRAAEKPVKPVLSSVVLVDRYQDQGGKWNLSFTLQDHRFTEVFLRLADDIERRSAGASTEISALNRVAVVVDEWRRLLKPRRLGLLTVQELRGLIGELYLLLNYFGRTRGMATAVEGWLGPMGLPQDFWYAEDGYHEAKTIGPAIANVKISSARQLDASPLDLLVLTVANTGEGTVGAVNLPALVGCVKKALSGEGAAVDSLDDRLSRLGVAFGDSFYEDTWFVVSKLSTYTVTDEFPSIRASGLPLGLDRVTYELELQAIEFFKRGTTEVH